MPTGLLHVEHVMGMAVSIDVRDDEVPVAALRDVIAWLHHVDATFSTYRYESPISAFGRGELELEGLSDEVRGVLDLCEQVHLDSDGAFDICAVPAPNGTRLDPSGLVKGWSIERAGAILTEAGARSFCINAGGDIVVRGEPEPGQPWVVGIRHPDDAATLAAVLEARGALAIATSATYERGAHIIVPRTGEPTTELASVTVVGPDLTWVDAYATTVFVMGLEGLEWLDRHPGYGGLVITHDGLVWSTAEMDRYRRRG